jgi:autotransporter-associated beta strand protein
MTLNDLAIGNHTLVVDDAGGNNYILAFDGTTTLSGDAIFHTVNGLTLANVTDGAGIFGITKNGASTLTINAATYNGTTTVNAGTLAAGSANIFDTGGPDRRQRRHARDRRV